MSGVREDIPSALSIGDLSITASSPSVPSVSAQSVSFSTGAPTYTKPTGTFDVAQLESFLEDNEDSELAQIQLGRLQHELGEYQADIQNELNEFNKETTAYQAQLQIAIQNAQLTSTDDVQKLQLYSAEVQDYQAQVGKEVQEYQSNLAQETQELGSNIQRIQAQLQALGSQYQLLQTRYQSELQRLSGVSKHGSQV
jgi:predicted  nucleic acid-binding Zn-ribbon protein